MLTTQIVEFKNDVASSGASPEIQTWATTAIDEGLKEVEDVNKAITISSEIAQAKIIATNAIAKTRKDLSKEIYESVDDAAVEAVIEKAEEKKAEIKLALQTTI